jgi:hypothetical protein
MTDCGVCLGGWDGDRADFFHSTKPKARKVHQCYECEREIKLGEHYERVSAKLEGELSTYTFCLLCSEIHLKFSCGEGRTFGTLWDEMTEYVFPELTTANKCFIELSAAAKAEVLRRWNEWKFRKQEGQ